MKRTNECRSGLARTDVPRQPTLFTLPLAGGSDAVAAGEGLIDYRPPPLSSQARRRRLLLPARSSRPSQREGEICFTLSFSSQTRRAHSLIEMLVVLIIVGILIAIVVPAVQRARESARMAQCIHNQGQLAKAVHMHVADEPYGRFPGYRAFASDGTTVIGWAPQVFEYLGKNDQPADPNTATYVEILVCPSNQGPKDSPRLNYVVNGGQAGIDSAVDGIFFDHAKAEKVFITKDDFGDGLTNTILLAENLDATEWNVTDEENQCLLWPLTAGNEVNSGIGARPSSHHPGGFVAAFADGSVKFMAESDINDDSNIGTANSYYVSLLTPGGNDSDPVSGGGGGGDGGGPPSGDAPPDCGDPNAPTVPGLMASYYKYRGGGRWYGVQTFHSDHEGGTVEDALEFVERRVVTDLPWDGSKWIFTFGSATQGAAAGSSHETFKATPPEDLNAGDHADDYPRAYIRFCGQLKGPTTGPVHFQFGSNDMIEIYVNGELLVYDPISTGSGLDYWINDLPGNGNEPPHVVNTQLGSFVHIGVAGWWGNDENLIVAPHNTEAHDPGPYITVDMVEDQWYDVELIMCDSGGGGGGCVFKWYYGGGQAQEIPDDFFRTNEY